MLSVYTRHSADCPRSDDGTWKRCKCPKWVWGTLNDEFIRRSAKTRSWEHAEEFRRNLEQQALAASSASYAIVPAQPVQIAPQPEGEVLTREKTIKFAVDKYLADAKSRGLEKSTLSKLENIFRKQFLTWATSEGYEYLDQIDLDAVKNFRGTWTDGALAKSKKQDRLIGFFWSCVRRGYIKQNPALEMGKIKVIQVPTDYFPRDEFNKIVDSTYVYGDPRGGFIPLEDLRLRLRAMTLLMRWSGLRIRDAVTLEKTRLHGDSLFLYQAKTGTPVYVPLPPYVVKSLNELPPGPKPNPRYFFWSGNGEPKSAVANWQRAFRRLFEIAAIKKLDGTLKRCHPHMFRDTFAVENLLAGIPIDQVSLLLGHASVKITEKSYAPFVKARQVQLQNSVRKAWHIADPAMAQLERPSATHALPN
jgi:integrase/recombinase XerD